MIINKAKIQEIEQYVDEYFYDEEEEFNCCFKECLCSPSIFSSSDDEDSMESLKKRVNANLSDTWQQSLFNLIDQQSLDEVEVYKRAQITKQVFSKIRSNEDYHPDKDTAIRLCIGLKLNLDQTLDLLGKAGYTLSPSIRRDLVVQYFIENQEYDIIDLDIVLERMNLKQFLKY